MGWLSPLRAGFTCFSQLAVALSKDEPLTSFQFVLRNDVPDSAVQPFRIVDPDKHPHNTLGHSPVTKVLWDEYTRS